MEQDNGKPRNQKPIIYGFFFLTYQYKDKKSTNRPTEKEEICNIHINFESANLTKKFKIVTYQKYF